MKFLNKFVKGEIPAGTNERYHERTIGCKKFANKWLYEFLKDTL